MPARTAARYVGLRHLAVHLDERGVEVLQEARVLALHERVQHVVLVGEVGVERPAREPRALADVLDGAADDAPLREDLAGRVQDALAGGLAARRAVGVARSAGSATVDGRAPAPGSARADRCACRFRVRRRAPTRPPGRGRAGPSARARARRARGRTALRCPSRPPSRPAAARAPSVSRPVCLSIHMCIRYIDVSDTRPYPSGCGQAPQPSSALQHRVRASRPTRGGHRCSSAWAPGPTGSDS